MRAPRTATTTVLPLLLLLLLLQLLPCAVRASGFFEVKLKSFANENGRDSLGKCCSGGQPAQPDGPCPGTCRTRFRVCLKQYQANIDTNTPCTYGDVVTPVLGDNSLNLTSTTSFANPIRFPFDFTWPGSFSLIIEAFHDNLENSTYSPSGTSAASSERVMITRLTTQQWLAVGDEWIENSHRSHHQMMLYEYRVKCAAHYFGKGCENLCRPRDDSFGHYRCSVTGERICLSGWKGDYCNIPHCLPGCDEQHGHCSKPNECICHNGWTGPFCDQCIRYPGCLHGSCQKPWECLCDEGWGGLFCNLDLNYCTNHKPCRNGGTCFNTGEGSYTCNCAPGFTGVDCETPMLDCQEQPCKNNGTCLTSASNATLETSSSADGSVSTFSRKYRCSCPSGFKGRHCEVSTRSCRDAPCAVGATCEDDSERGYTCHCPVGYAGPECNVQIDDCAVNPCANGGTCTDLLAGFRCTCPSGFAGERCQVNIDDCASSPCRNGATCVDQINRFRCRCPNGFVGELCQDKFDYCANFKPCANGGRCLSTSDDYQCACKPGFSGKDCSVEVDECKSSPCQHGGSCRNRVNGFVCECPDGWRGETCAEPPAKPGAAGYWAAAGPDARGHHVAAAPEARHAALTTEHVVVIATLSTAVPAFVLVAALAVMCMKRRQKREQAKADEEARLQNERNAVHSSMSKRAGALLSPQQLEPGGCHGGPTGDSHMIKNTWTAASSCAQGLLAERCQGKSVNTAPSGYDDEAGYKAEPVSCGGGVVGLGAGPESRGRSTKQLNTEAAAHRASALYQKATEKECALGAALGLASACQQALEASKRVSALYGGGGGPDSGCCAASACAEASKRPAEAPPDEVDGCGVYVIDEHCSRLDAANLAAQLATEV